VEKPEDLAKFEQAQGQLSSALSRLMVVVEKYPELKATQGFRDLHFSLEQTENRIGQERRRFNEAAQAFNTKRDSFPTVIIAGLFGSKFQPKVYFASEAGAEKAPEVKF
jgi:LemA protein